MAMIACPLSQVTMHAKATMEALATVTLLHVCSFCLSTIQKLCKHSEAVCKRKEVDEKKGGGGLRQATPEQNQESDYIN